MSDPADRLARARLALVGLALGDVRKQKAEIGKLKWEHH